MTPPAAVRVAQAQARRSLEAPAQVSVHRPPHPVTCCEHLAPGQVPGLDLDLDLDLGLDLGLDLSLVLGCGWEHG